MSENLNWIDQLRKSFKAFEPEVTGDWNRMEGQLDALEHSEGGDMARKMKNAQRIAVGATAIAAGMAFWMLAPTITESTEEAYAVGGSVAVESTFGESSIASESPIEEAGSLATNEGARTSNTFVIDLPSLTVKAEKAMNIVEEAPEVPNVGPNQAASEALRESSSGLKSESTGVKAKSSPLGEIDAALAAMSASVQEACAGTEVHFALNGLDQEGSVLWNFGDGGFSQDVAPSHIYEDAGSYDITVSVRAPGDGMIRTRTVENMIVVRPKPAAKMNWEFSEATADRARIHFINETEDASSSTWLLEQEGLKEPETLLEIPGDYHVNLVASNKFGCQDIAVEDIQLGSRKDAIAPALFSPDGDGRYDTFMPLMVMDFEGEWSLTIWDGDIQVFETNTARTPWKGQVGENHTAEIGKTYTWKLSATTPTGEQLLFVDEVLIDGE